MLLKLYAVVIVASLAGAMGAFFVHRREEAKSA
jgi:CRISPR/Cas system-associated protein Csm6